MRRPDSLPGLLGRVLLLALPAALLWWLSLDSLLLPALRWTVEQAAQFSFPQARLTLSSAPDTANTWHLSSYYLLSEQSPDPRRLLLLNLRITPLFTYTFGFPLLWALVLAVPRQRWRNLLLASGAVFLFSALALYSKLLFHLTGALSDGSALSLLLRIGYEQPLPIYPAWWLEALNPLRKFFAYLAMLFAPPLFVYLLNRAWFDALFSQVRQTRVTTAKESS